MIEEKRPRGRPARQRTPTDAIKRVREALGLTQVQFAAEMNCSESSVARYERQGTMPETGALRAQLEKLAKRASVKLESETTST